MHEVNNSEETLTSVSSTTGGCQALDDEVMPVSSPDPLYFYKNVKPCEAVKVENYDPFWDLDFLLQHDKNGTEVGYWQKSPIDSRKTVFHKK